MPQLSIAAKKRLRTGIRRLRAATHALRSVDHGGAMEDCRVHRNGGRQVCAHVNHAPEVAYSIASAFYAKNYSMALNTAGFHGK